MPIVSAGFVNQAKLESDVRDVISKLGPDVVRVYYNFGTDSTGDPAIFFRIVLTDAASKEEKLTDVINQIMNTLFEELLPQENWGLLPYFSFRSKSEQETRNDPGWR